MPDRPPVFEGVGVALVTLFDKSGELDAGASAAHAVHLVEAGVSAIVIAGTTGEASTLDIDERSLLLEEVGSALDGHVPLIAGTGAQSARQAIELSGRAASGGADAVIALTPPGVADPLTYYERIRSSIQIPLLAYHYPQVSPPGVPIEILGDLQVDGLKDSSGDAERLIREKHELPGQLYTGQHALLLLAGQIGAAGAILAMANLDTQLCLEAWAGDPEAQQRIVYDHANVGSIAALKHELSTRLGTSPSTRLG